MWKQPQGYYAIISTISQRVELSNLCTVLPRGKSILKKPRIRVNQKARTKQSREPLTQTSLLARTSTVSSRAVKHKLDVAS